MGKEAILGGIISGLIASGLFFVFLKVFVPRVKISDKIIKSRGSKGGIKYKIKIVNRSRLMGLTSVDYYFDRVRGREDGGDDEYTSSLKLDTKHDEKIERGYLDRRRAKKEGKPSSFFRVYCLQKNDMETPLEDGHLFRLRIYAVNAFSGTGKTYVREYTADDIVDDAEYEFNNGASVDYHEI